MKTIQGLFGNPVEKAIEAYGEFVEKAVDVIERVNAVLEGANWGWDITTTIYLEDPAALTEKQKKKLRKIGFKNFAKLPDQEDPEHERLVVGNRLVTLAVLYHFMSRNCG